MSMKCTLCQVRYSLSTPQPDSTGALVFMCIECAAQHARPKRFAEGTMQPVKTANDFADHVQAANDNELHIALGRAEAAVSCLRVMVERWGKEMRCGHSTPEMQWVLRKAKELIG